ncbi:LysR family transcriptional regulator [Caldimonas sp.]|uniref:helix-turn-helix domain-containing protein n=1 Tax=Caldimonas sp. TaxID=2838790 RepID=UPI00391C4FBA
MNRHITLRQFRYFLLHIAVAESSSVAATSRMLYIAQSAITKSILELEDALGVSLFERSPRAWCSRPTATASSPVRARCSQPWPTRPGLHRAKPSPLSGPLAIGVTTSRT